MPVQKIILIVMLVILMLSSASRRDREITSDKPGLVRVISVFIYVIMIALALSI